MALAIYDDRMEISNHGGLLPNLTLEQIKAGFSEPRNPSIAEVFYRCRMIEKRGKGVPKLIKSCKETNDPEPAFSNGKAECKMKISDQSKTFGYDTRRTERDIDSLN